MWLKNKKFYSLLDIKNQIVYTPLIFVIVLAFVSSFVVYLFFEYQESNKIKLVVQSQSIYNENILKNYIQNVNTKTSENIDETEKNLVNFVYEVKGYTKSFLLRQEALNIQLIKNYMYLLKEDKNVDFILFDAITYDVLYGKETIEYLRRQTNSKINTKKFTQSILNNIQYNSNNSMTYWIDNQKREIRLSFFKFIDPNGLMLGVFSDVDDMKVLTRQSILESLVNASNQEERSHFIFYDINEKVVYNYYSKGEKTFVKDIKNFDILKDEEFVYSFPKYNFKIIIKDNFLENDITQIRLKHENRLLVSIFIILFVAIVLITTANIFGRFINTIFNRYNQRFQRKNLLLTKWKDRYELAIIASNDGLWDINLNTNKIFFSNKWLEMFGYERDEIQNFKEWLSLIHEDDKQKVLNEFSLHIAGKSEHFICEYRLKHKKGDYKWILVRGKAFVSENTNRMLMMSMDIDSRVKMTKEVRSVEQLTEYGRIVIFRWKNDENLSVRFVSKSIENYGFSVDEFMNSNINYLDFVHKDDISIFKSAMQKAIQNDDKAFTAIHRVVGKNKEIRWVYNRTILIKDDHGKVRFFFGYLNDITKIKLNEEELKHQVEVEVEKNIQKDRLLIQQNKMASMGEMLGNIAHQWRQPLNNINLLLHFIRDNYDNFTKEDLNDSVKSAKLQIDYMSQTIDDFRNFYQPTKDKKLFDIKKSIIQSSKIVASSFERSDVKLQIIGDDISIENYENEFEQVIVNILNNAVDAAIIKKQKEKFKASVNIEVLKKDKIYINISNNCGRIDDEVIDRIFEPYFTTKFENQGTGIGLYMSKVIIEKNMKGLIEAKNTRDGVVFTIIL